jgi:hypothetical protein
MRAKKDRLLPASKVPIVFSNKRVREITAGLRPPLDDDQTRRFAASLRQTARIYLGAKRAQKVDVSDEVKALYCAAEQHEFEKAATLMRDLSTQTREFLNKRAARIGLKLPRPIFFLDRARRRSACETVRRLSSQGGHMEAGKWVPHLYLPRHQPIYELEVQRTILRWIKAAHKRGVKTNMRELRRKAIKSVSAVNPRSPEGRAGRREGLTAKARAKHPELRSPKRQPERDFIMFLQVDFLIATGRNPPRTARKYGGRDRTPRPSPFVEMVQKCLELLGVEKVDVIEQINKLQKRRGAAQIAFSLPALTSLVEEFKDGSLRLDADTDHLAVLRCRWRLRNEAAA